MIKKAFLIISVVFFIQVLNSCDRGCGEYALYDISYDYIEVKAWNTSGFQLEEVQDTVYKNAFGLSLYVNQIRQRVAQSIYNIPSFGFNTAYALSCIEPEYQYSDPISFAEIFVVDSVNATEKNANNFFISYDYGSHPISVDELFEIRTEWHDSFQFELEKTDSIPNSCAFRIDLYLESGKIISNQTPIINFFP